MLAWAAILKRRRELPGLAISRKTIGMKTLEAPLMIFMLKLIASEDTKGYQATAVVPSFLTTGKLAMPQNKQHLLTQVTPV